MASFTTPPSLNTSQTLGGNDSGTVGSGSFVTVATGPAIAVALATAPTSSGGVVLTNSGTISTTSSGRAIDATGMPTGARTLIIANNEGATITSQNDAIRINNNLLTGSVVQIDNSGSIATTGAGSGQAIDFDNIASTGSTTTITNRANGTISAADADAVRPGQNGDVQNYGKITANAVPVPADQPGADGVDFQSNHTGSVHNFGTGIISGAKGGVAGGTNTTVQVANDAGGQIIGRNGSGVGLDGSGSVTNSGIIRGTIDTSSARGDGDGVDIDFTASITNFGTIEGLGAKGNDSGGRANAGEGVSIGGGTIDNHGVIRSSATNPDGATVNAGGAVIVNNDAMTNRSGNAATILTNYAGGSITGGSTFAIRLENKGSEAISADTITNYGAITGNGTVPNPNGVVTYVNSRNGMTETDANSVGTLDGVTYTGTGSARFIRGDGAAIQMGEGSDVLTNYGTITGNSGRALNLEGGSDTLNLYTGSTIAGRIDGGAGSDTLDLRLDDRTATNVADRGANSGATAGVLGNVVNFESLSVEGGGWTIADAQSFVTGTSIASGGTLLVDGTLTSNVALASGGSLAGAGTVAGTVTVDGTLSASAAASGVASTTGTLSTGALTLDATATLRADIGGAGTDLVKASGAVTLATGATLDLEAAGAITSAAGQRVTLIDNTSAGATTGRFTTLVLNGGAGTAIAADNTFQANGRTYQLSYTGSATGSTPGNDITLTDVTANPPNPPTGATPGPNNLTGTDAANTISLLAGNDTYRGAGGNDRINGDAGNDRIYGDAGNDTINAGTGNDYARGGDDNDRLSGDAGTDRLYGDAGRDALDGGADNDYLRGGGDSDTITGGTGNDRLYGDDGRDFLNGGEGNDYLVGGDGPDVLTGGPGNDILIGGEGADRYVFTPDQGAVDLIRGFSTTEGDRLDLGGQDYTVRYAGDGDAILTLSGGSQVRLDGVTQQEFGNGAGYFVG